MHEPRHRHPQPLVRHPHPTAEHHGRAQPQHRADHQAGHRRGRLERATVIVAGNPAAVQLAGSDTLVSLPLAQHIAAATIVAGNVVVALLFTPTDPNDGLIVAAY
ncbi:MAG: hypothetical protein ACR2PL_11075 [Dehalococcoidia bacterium]